MTTLAKLIADLYQTCGPEAVNKTVPVPSTRKLDRLVKDIMEVENVVV
jgi:hypothetical protein